MLRVHAGDLTVTGNVEGTCIHVSGRQPYRATALVSSQAHVMLKVHACGLPACTLNISCPPSLTCEITSGPARLPPPHCTGRYLQAQW